MAQPSVPFQPTNIIPPPAMVIRSRRETSTRDTGNARQFEHWQTDGKAMTQNRPDPHGQAPFHEFLPINSRFEGRDYKGQPRFDATGAPLGKNTYFDKYDPSYDSRNVTRELASTIYEDKDTTGSKENSKLLARNFDNRWLSVEEQKKQLEASMNLRPLMDDYSKVYRVF